MIDNNSLIAKVNVQKGEFCVKILCGITEKFLQSPDLMKYERHQANKENQEISS
jgi:hypothetical protein